MQTVAEIALQRAERGVFTRDQAALWVGNRGAALDALLKRAVSSGEVWRVHRGLYCLSDRYTKSRVNPLELAQRIHGPSYVSLESALSYHGWIPEAVRAITSVTLARSRAFETPVGLFTFTRVPQRRLFSGVRRASVEEGGAFFLATPLKALADLVYAQRHDWHSATPVIESLRVDDRVLTELTGALFDEVISSVCRFLAGLRRDLKL